MREVRRNRGGWKGLEWGDVCVLVDGTNAQSPPLFDVVHDQGVPLFGSASDDNTGLITIWAVTTPSAPYENEENTKVGALAPGGVAACQPQSLQLKANELVQARVKVRLIDASPASGAVIDDFAVRAYNPGSTAVWNLANQKGVLSARTQVGDGADSVSAPLQGTDQAGPAFAALSGFETADQTELWWYGVNAQPTFEVCYFGAAPTPAGIAIALEVSGYRYILAEHPFTGGRQVTRGGVKLTVPPDVDVADIVGIITAGRGA